VLFVSITYALLDQKPESELKQGNTTLADMVISILLVNMEKRKEKRKQENFWEEFGHRPVSEIRENEKGWGKKRERGREMRLRGE
jgi:hypothetical protein